MANSTENGISSAIRNEQISDLTDVDNGVLQYSAAAKGGHDDTTRVGEGSSFNPFDSEVESYLHLPFCSPQMFANSLANNETSTPGRNQEERSFRWSIDSLAVLKPAEINDDEISRQEMLTELRSDDSVQERAESAIDMFFSYPVIVPSPWSAPRGPALLSSSKSSSAAKHVTFSPHPSVATYFNGDVSGDLPVQADPGGKRPADGDQGKACKVDASCQTTLSLPLDFDLQAVLGPAFYSNTDGKSANNESMSTSNLRRKLFFHEESFSDPVSPVKPMTLELSNDDGHSPPLTPYQSSSSTEMKHSHASGNTTKSQISHLRQTLSPIRMHQLDDEDNERQLLGAISDTDFDIGLTPTHHFAQCTPSTDGNRSGGRHHLAATPGMSPVFATATQFKTLRGGASTRSPLLPQVSSGGVKPHPRTPGSLGRIDEGQVGFGKPPDVRSGSRLHHLQARSGAFGSPGPPHHQMDTAADDSSTHFSRASKNHPPPCISPIARACFAEEGYYNSPVFLRKWTSRISPLADGGYLSPGMSPIGVRGRPRPPSKRPDLFGEKVDMYFEDERHAAPPTPDPAPPRSVHARRSDNSVQDDGPQLESTRNALDLKSGNLTDPPLTDPLPRLYARLDTSSRQEYCGRDTDSGFNTQPLTIDSQNPLKPTLPDNCIEKLNSHNEHITANANSGAFHSKIDEDMSVLMDSTRGSHSLSGGTSSPSGGTSSPSGGTISPSEPMLDSVDHGCESMEISLNNSHCS